MRIIDEKTNQEITNPDLSVGVLQAATWAPPEAYATIDNKTKFALDESDYEQVQIYHVWTAEEIEQREAAEQQAEHQEIMNALPDALADLSLDVSNGAADTADLQDALADLSIIVNDLINQGA